MSEKGGRRLTVDPSLPRWVCQNCRHSLCIVGADSHADRFLNDFSPSGMQASSMHGANSVLASKMENSFVVLPKQGPQAAQGVPPRPHGGVGNASQTGNH